MQLFVILVLIVMLSAVLCFPVRGGRLALPVPSPAAISLIITSLVYPAPLWGRRDLHETMRSRFQE
jgi:hypothetical protein